MMVQNNNHQLNLAQAIKTQVKQHGISGVFAGQFATALREGCFSVFFLAVTPIFKSYLKPYCSNDTFSSLAAGVSSGIMATVVSQPLDTIKTIQQSSASQSMGFFKTAKSVGLAHLFNGMLSRSSSVIVSLTLMSWMREQLENYCLESHHASISHPKP